MKVCRRIFYMTDGVMWNINQDKAYGQESNFHDEDEFVNGVKTNCEELTGNSCVVKSVRLEKCICTAESIDQEVIVGLSQNNSKEIKFYIADVEIIDPIATEL
jgi:hypothetical protein